MSEMEPGSPSIAANTEKTCFPLNSHGWLKSRYGNIDDDNPLVALDDKDYLQKILGQSLCHESSAFRNPPVASNHPQDNSDIDITQQWIFRLAYLGIHMHQNNPAQPEILQRQRVNKPCSGSDQATWGGRHDYECPDTKFLITDVPTYGVGADIRLGVVPSMIAGLALNRTVLIMSAVPKALLQNATNSSRILVPPWPLSGCPDRRDYQCFFLPLSPCVPSIQDLQNAVVLPDSQATREVQEKGDFANKTIHDARVVIMPSQARLPKKINFETLRRAGKRLQELIVQQLRRNNNMHVPEYIVQNLSNHSIFLYRPHGQLQGLFDDGSRSIVNAAALLYIFRLNSDFSRQVDTVAAKAIPNDFSSDYAFGMPVRASDKCGMESSCLSFENYMELVMQQRQRYFGASIYNRTTMDIILTSESANIMEARKRWENKPDFPFRFLVNSDDTMQGSGWPAQYKGQANAVMLSSFVALKLQLLSRHLVANCCSRFHEVLVDLFKFGCGASRDSPSIHCMQELEDERFRLCCHLSGIQATKCQSSDKHFEA